MVWFLRLAVLVRGKNFTRKALVNSSHVVMHPRSKEWSHALTLFLSEKGKSNNQIISVETLLSFKMSHTSKNTKSVSCDLPMGCLQIGIVAMWK